MGDSTRTLSARDGLHPPRRSAPRSARLLPDAGDRRTTPREATTSDARPTPCTLQRIARAIAAAFTLALVVTTSHAQEWTEWGIDLYRKPLLSTRALGDLAKRTSMTDDQRRAAELLLSAYHAEHQSLIARGDEVRGYVQFDAHLNLVEAGEWYQQQYEVNRKLGAKVESLNRTLMDDLRTLLTASQQAQFAELELTLLRQRLQRMAERESPAISELTELFRSLELADAVREAIAPALRTYQDAEGNELDAYAVLREKYLKEWDSLIGTYTGSPDQIPKSTREVGEELQRARGRLHAIRRRHLEQIRQLVPAEHRAAFDEALNRRLFPRVYRMDRIANMLEVAITHESLDEGVRTTVREIKDSYQRDAASATKRWLEALDAEHRAWCLQEPTEEVTAKAGETYEARRAVDKAALDRLTALLTPEQRREVSVRASSKKLDLDQGGKAE